MRKSNKKKVLKKKDGERNPCFTPCASRSQRDETHRMEQVAEVQRRYYSDGCRSATTD